MQYPLKTSVYEIILCISQWYYTFLSVSRGNTLSEFRELKSLRPCKLEAWKLPTQLTNFIDFWAKILRIAHPVNYSFLTSLILCDLRCVFMLRESVAWSTYRHWFGVTSSMQRKRHIHVHHMPYSCLQIADMWSCVMLKSCGKIKCCACPHS